ncbi:MAG: hypothetical protein Q9182_002013 [Xanthomendoza sp. 2 TL-2023]
MSVPSRRLSLLKKFERQVAPLEKYHVDILGLCQDTREEIEYLERKKGITGPRDETHRRERELSVSSRSSSEQCTLANESDYEPRSRMLKRAEALHDQVNVGADEKPKGKSVNEDDGAAKDHRQAQAYLRRAKSQREPKNISWLGIFTKKMHRGREHHPASTTAFSPSQRNISPSPSKSAPENPEKRPRSRLSKKKPHPGSGKNEHQSTDPPVHPNTIWNANIPHNPLYDDDDDDDDNGGPGSPQNHLGTFHTGDGGEEEPPYIHPDHRHRNGTVDSTPYHQTSDPNPLGKRQRISFIPTSTSKTPDRCSGLHCKLLSRRGMWRGGIPSMRTRG